MKYYFFDLDGTITDPKEGITKSVAYALKKYDIRVQNLDELCPFIGPPLFSSFMEFYGFDKEKAMEAVKFYREYYEVKGIYECKLYDGIPKLLKDLKAQGHHIIMATSKPTDMAIRLVEHFQLTEFFDFIAGSTRDSSRVEKEDVLKYALEQFPSIDIEQCCMIGDRKFDAIGAKQVHMKCILVEYGYGNRKELEECKPLWIAETVEVLGKYLLSGMES